jgi:hypothetical protein
MPISSSILEKSGQIQMTKFKIQSRFEPRLNRGDLNFELV